jgi:multidrug efflux pump subunit AcrA (membrane-fusion protein)
MPNWLITVLTTAGTILLTLIITAVFNKMVGLPKELKKQRAAEAAAQAARDAAEQEKEAQRAQADADRDAKIAALEAAVNALPSYRAQSLQIQSQLQTTDLEILSALSDIKSGIKENQNILTSRLDRLEDREKNAIRAKLLDEYRLFTDEHKNPMRAWSEMEHHAFFKLVKDYEDLDGNDYVHDEVLPAMNRLEVIPMSNKEKLLDLMQSRRL